MLQCKDILEYTNESIDDLYERLIEQEKNRIKDILKAEERFWKYVDKNGPIAPHMNTPCWMWTGAKYYPPRQYGLFMLNGASIKACKFILELTMKKPIPKGLLILHDCDNATCVNPDHLHLGTHKENMRDMALRKRAIAPRGEKNHNAKLSWSKVEEIRYRYANGKISFRKLSKDYGVHPLVIAKVIREQTWKSEWKP